MEKHCGENNIQEMPEMDKLSWRHLGQFLSLLTPCPSLITFVHGRPCHSHIAFLIVTDPHFLFFTNEMKTIFNIFEILN